jgi:hypothetical protein
MRPRRPIKHAARTLSLIPPNPRRARLPRDLQLARHISNPLPRKYAIMAKLSVGWFPHYAVVAWISDVEVAREDRYL